MEVKVFMTFFYCFLFRFSQAQLLFDSAESESSKQATININLSSRHSVIFNTSDEPIIFKNHSAGDSIVSKRIDIAKPFHIFYENVLITTKGEKEETGSLILFPGDSIFLANNGKRVKYSTGFKNYIDSIIAISTACYGSNTGKMLDSIGFRAMLTQIGNKFRENDERISGLSLPSARIRALKNFNYLLKAKELCAIPFNKVAISDRLLLDSLYNDLLKNVDILSSINSPFSKSIYFNIISFNAFKNGKNTDGFWSYFDKVDSNIVNSSFYRPYIIASIKNIYRNSPDKIPLIAKNLKTSSGSFLFNDTLSAIVDILLKTKTDYNAAKKEIDRYASGKYSFLLDEKDIFHRQQRNIRSLIGKANLIDFKGNKTSFQNLLSNSKTNISVLDFWASWCVPCIADYPYLKKTETALKNNSVRFISISIDAENDIDKWINRTKELKTYNMPNQYRLENPKHSPVTSYFNLYSIPRYIVIDKTGNILDEDFDRPNEESFQRKLQIYLGSYSK